MKDIILGVILLLQSVMDMKYKEIPLIVSCVGAGMGVMICIFEGRLPIQILLAGIPGIVAILFAKISNETMGYGDGIILLVMGLYLPWKEVCGIVMLAFFIAGFVAVVLLIFFQKKGHDQIPFIPFLLLAYSMRFLINGGSFV